MRGAEYGREGDKCTFQVMLERHDLCDDTALVGGTSAGPLRHQRPPIRELIPTLVLVRVLSVTDPEARARTYLVA
jgi:hypothetical protein